MVNLRSHKHNMYKGTESTCTCNKKQHVTTNIIMFPFDKSETKIKF